jgi:hypothetical protein
MSMTRISRPREPLDDERWEALSHAYWEALQRSESERAAYLASSGASPSVIAEVLEMLDASEGGRGTSIERRLSSERSRRARGSGPTKPSIWWGAGEWARCIARAASTVSSS